MLKRRSSRLSPFSSYKSKTSTQSAPMPGRTLILSSTPSILNLSETSEDSPSDINAFTIDTIFPSEPLFHHDYLDTHYSSERPPSLSMLLGHDPLNELSSRRPTVNFNMDLDQPEFSSSDDEDDIIDSYCRTPPDMSLLATQITVLYSGKARMIDIFPLKETLRQPPPIPPQSASRRSSSSTRDNSISLSSRYSSGSGSGSDSDSRPSPASSISEYSNLVYETIPEGSPYEPQPYADVDMKPFRRSHRRNMSSNSGLPVENMKQQPQVGIRELPSSSTSSLSKGNPAIPRWETRPRMSSFLSDDSSSGAEDNHDQVDYWHENKYYMRCS